jgi:PKD repeat protein
VPATLWGELEPLDIGFLPAVRDQSPWSQDGGFLDGNHPFWNDVDTEGSWVFTSHNTGLHIWQHTGTASFPKVGGIHLGNIDGNASTLPRFCSTPELKHPISMIDVPNGDSDVAVIGSGYCETGFYVFNTANKTAPSFKYQADGRDLGGLWTTKISASEQYVVAGYKSGGVHVYDLDLARGLTTACKEAPASPGPGTCGGIYIRRLGSLNAIAGVHGVGTTVAVSSSRFELWNIAGGSALASFDPGLNGFNTAVGMFTQGGSTYLAGLYLATGARTELTVWNVTSCLSFGCVGTPPVAAGPISLPDADQPRYLSVSERGGHAHLFIGSEITCAGPDQSEWLFEVKPNGGGIVLDELSTPAYWKWYYATNANGTFDLRPRKARFLGDILYRAGWSILDAHRFEGLSAPTAGFAASASTVYAGDLVDFTDTSSGSPTSWAWDLGADGSVESTAQNPSLAVQPPAFPTLYPVRLTAANAAGSTQATSQLEVLDPCPRADGLTTSTTNSLACQAITFTLVNLTGRNLEPTGWSIVDDRGQVLETLPDTGPTAVWRPLVAGRYMARSVVAGEAECAELTLTGAGVEVRPLALLGVDTPLVTSQVGDTVGFSVTSESASEWSWDFDDDNNDATSVWSAWTDDPVLGPAPSHTYTTTNPSSHGDPRRVRVRVRNCVDTAPLVSDALEIFVDFGDPPGLEEFRLVCIGNPFCILDTGVPVALTVTTSGTINSYGWDWDGDTTVDEVTAGPLAFHTYCEPGGPYQPRLTVTNSHGSLTATNVASIFVTGSNLCVPPFFADGFESGSTSGWSATTP